MLRGDATAIPSLTLTGSKDFSGIDLKIPTEGPVLKINDENLARAVLGTVRLSNNRTGSTEIRAPSSLVLFDEEGKVVWSAP